MTATDLNLKPSEQMDIIFDIDGTLADLSHRKHFVEKTPKDWVAFQALAHLDSVHEQIARVNRSLGLLAHRIVLCSGRGEQERPVTEVWLAKHQIVYQKLYMRPEGDYRADDIIKEELLMQIRADGYRPVLAFDDRDRVVAMWRRHGIVCCQVAEGNF